MRNTFLLVVLMLGNIMTSSLVAQTKNDGIETKYRRSSLHTILIESDKFPKKDTVLQAYYNAPFPDKYNDHNIGIKSFNPLDFPVTDEERMASGVKQSKMGSAWKEAAAQATAGIVNPNGADMPLIIDKFVKKNKIANKLVAKWFDRHEDGSFDMDLIGKRGFYNASEMEADVAESSARGRALLADAGEELINNTFVVFSRLNFVSNELLAKAVKEAVTPALNKIKNELARGVAEVAAEAMYSKASEGYSVWTTSYLYKLTWNDSIAAVFYKDMWFDSAHVDSLKKKMFDETDLFTLELVGKEHSRNLVVCGEEGASDGQIIEMATVRNQDAVYAKLQKKYDVFKTKTPIYSCNPVTARIGMKEGLKGGEKFEVLEQVFDKKTGRTKYVRRGKISVDKKGVWDNRYNAGDMAASKESDVHSTKFKGGKKKIYPGMLIRQIK